MNRLSTAFQLKSPSQILLDSFSPTSPAGPVSSFTSQANMSLPTSVRRVSAVNPPNAQLIEETVRMAGNDIPMSDLLRSPTDGKAVFPISIPEPASQSSSFATYYTGAVSAVSPKKIVGLSVSFVASIVVFTYVQHEVNLSPIPLSLGICILCALALRFIIPARFLLLSSYNSANPVGTRLQVTAVFSDKARTYRAIALGVIQVVFITLFAYSASIQTMTSMHMNYFSVLPPLDFVLQKFLLRIPIKTSKRSIASAALNLAPQALALLAWDWVVGLEAIPVAVTQILWIFIVYLEQASTETAAWLASVYVSFLISTAILLPLSIGSWLYAIYYPAEEDTGIVASSITDLGATIVCAISIGTLFLTSGFLVKWSSSAHIVVLVSAASLILICLSDAVIAPGMKFAAATLSAMAWAVYVK